MGKTAQSNPLQALLALAAALAPAEAPKETQRATRKFNVPEGFRAVSVLSREEIAALVTAAESGESQTVTVGNRTTLVRVIGESEVLDSGKNARETLKGEFQIARRSVSQA